MRMEYPKIETVWNRDDKTRRVIPGQYRIAEFGIVNNWHVTEKIDGTNVRVMMDTEGVVTFNGRTDNAQMPVTLMSYLIRTFTPEKMHEAFPATNDIYPNLILFGEGYGPKIQKVGGSYRKDISFRLFDVRVGEWWLEQDTVVDVAQKLEIKTAPPLGIIASPPKTIDELEAIIGHSVVAQDEGGSGCLAEGIVARSYPLLLTRSRQRVMWKLKRRDFGA